MGAYLENFVSIRSFTPKYRDWRAGGNYSPIDPIGELEVEPDYRDLLLAANEAYLHREYAIALELYLELRQKILVQSHPELPGTPRIVDDVVFDTDLIDHGRLVELSRRYLTRTVPGAAITLPAGDHRLFAAHEVKANETLAKYSSLTVDPGLSAKTSADALRHDARRQVVEGDSTAAQRVYDRQVERALDDGDVRLAADTIAESGAVLATYEKNAGDRAAVLFTRAAEYYRILGDTTAVESMAANLRQLAGAASVEPRQIEDPGGGALTLGGVAWTGSRLFNANGTVMDNLAQHEAVHSRTVAAIGELGFYFTYVTLGVTWSAAQSGPWNSLDREGCGHPFEKQAHTFTGDPAKAASQSNC